MDRAPYLSILFFVAAGILFVYGVFGGSAIPFGASEPEDATAVSPAEARSRRIAAFARSWPKEPSYETVFRALETTPVSTPMSAGPVINFDPDDDYWGLPRDEGYELVSAYCAGCHSLQIVMQQRASVARWRYLLNWMVTEQNMAPLTTPDEAVVLAYLVRNFGAVPQ